ncbi:peptide ABC transporter substrate-binding protein [Puniceicoccaceae bacterium K14]|nr:peptide ABC transporter substrate-binding protein [Puniceicoccaceae bacterium K14]
MIRSVFPTFLLVLVATFLSSCGPGSGDNKRDTATQKGILLFGNEAEPPSLDAHLITTIPGFRVVNALTEGLIAYHKSDDNIPEPGVAEKWTHSDNQYWTFHLRKNARWSNGDILTAHDFIYSFERALSPQLGARYAEMLFLIKNAEAFNKGELSNFSEVGVKAINDHTLTIELIGPIPYFLNLLKHPTWYPVHPSTIEKYGGMTKPDSNWTREEYVGNGPFILEEWTINKIISVRPNPMYWDSKTVRLNGIDFFPINDISTEDKIFNSGGLHYQNTIPSDLIPGYKKANDPYLRMEPWMASYYYQVNTEEPHLQDKRVRQALSLAINRRAIVKRIMKGDQAIALSVTPSGIAGYTPPQTESFNPKKARQLLAEAGYPNGTGFPKTNLVYNTSDQHKAVAESIQQMWYNILGIEVSIRNLEWKTFISARENKDYEIARSGWIGDYVYPDTFLTLWQSGNGNNTTGWSNPRYDQLINDSLVEANSERRLELLAEAEKILMDELPLIPLFYYNRIYRIDPTVKNWFPKISDSRNYKYIYLEAEGSN